MSANRFPPGTDGALLADRERWQQVSALFDEVMEVPESEREAFLARDCPSPDLRAEVAALLRAAAETGGPLADPLVVRESALQLLRGDLPPLDNPDDLDGGVDMVGALVGPYRIVRLLGRGGMGAVYLAERVAGGFEQQVALKIVRPDAANEELRRRFTQERQILAGLQHPNIARLLDGGVTEDGRPYFALEYVEGTAIIEHCTRLELPTAERLRLLAEVCDAVDAAHEQRIVHRDLKPSNVLVTTAGRVRLLDFGIAKLLAQETSAETAGASPATRVGLRLLTPEYAAPEQRSDGAITPATDVYALGLLLVELVAGRRPSVTAPRPRLQGPLEAIVQTALREEPELRYARAGRLGDDLRALLADRTVTARPDTLRYRVARVWRRRRTSIVSAIAGAAAVLVLAAIAGTGLPDATNPTPPAPREPAAIGTESREAHELYLRGSFLRNRRRAADIRKGIGLFEQAVAIDPGYARAHAGLASAYNMLNEYAAVPAAESYPRARDAAQRALELDPGLVEAHLAMATVHRSYEHDWRAAETALRRGIALDPRDLTARRRLASHLAATGRLEEAFAELRRARDLDPLSAPLNHELGLLHYIARDYSRAIAQFEKTLELQPDLVVSRELIVQSHLLRHDLGPALDAAREIVRLDPERSDMLALVHAHSGHPAEAHDLLRQLAERAARPGAGYVSPSSLALVYAGLGETDRAFELLARACSERDWLVTYLAVEPLLDDLRLDPRFESLLAEVGLRPIGR